MGSSPSITDNTTKDFIDVNSFRDENVGPVDILINHQTKELLIRKRFTNLESMMSKSEMPMLIERIKRCPKY